ncbi:MAG: hypothetical protein P9M15_07920, partial [Candidatus Electryoneaceae bacterium]|nr:hypothetical protein [Candidatus Electryoneaceae bacterium]
MMHTCPICGNECKEVHNGDGFHLDCKFCGSYFITRTADLTLGHPRYSAKKYILSGVTRNANENNQKTKINSGNIDELIETANIPADPIEAMELLLLYLASCSDVFGKLVPIHAGYDYPIVFSRKPEEIDFHIKNLFKRGFIDGSYGGAGEVRITLLGWEKIAELKKGSADSNQAFVAMHFVDEMYQVFDKGFKPALEDEEIGFKAYLV